MTDDGTNGTSADPAPATPWKGIRKRKGGRRVKRKIVPPKLASLADRLDPLDYMLRVIGDPRATTARRDRLALAALPYCHAKPGEARVPKPATTQRYVTKKELQARAADQAVAGAVNGGWGDDLRVED